MLILIYLNDKTQQVRPQKYCISLFVCYTYYTSRCLGYSKCNFKTSKLLVEGGISQRIGFDNNRLHFF